MRFWLFLTAVTCAAPLRQSLEITPRRAAGPRVWVMRQDAKSVIIVIFKLILSWRAKGMWNGGEEKNWAREMLCLFLEWRSGARPQSAVTAYFLKPGDGGSGAWKQKSLEEGERGRHVNKRGDEKTKSDLKGKERAGIWRRSASESKLACLSVQQMAQRRRCGFFFLFFVIAKLKLLRVYFAVQRCGCHRFVRTSHLFSWSSSLWKTSDLLLCLSRGRLWTSPTDICLSFMLQLLWYL